MLFRKNGHNFPEVMDMRSVRWRIRLLAWLLAGCLLWTPSAGSRPALGEKLTRLHVLANSDSDADQALKLQVRDAVLAASADAGQVDAGLLEQLEETAQQTVRQAGYAYPVRVTREYCYFDTRQYDGFTLPAGYYDAVRVVIGAGAGKNWWCVIYPPLCAGLCETDWETVAREAGLTEDEIGLICEEEGYVIRFRLLDWWAKLRHCFLGD